MFRHVNKTLPSTAVWDSQDKAVNDSSVRRKPSWKGSVDEPCDKINQSNGNFETNHPKYQHNYVKTSFMNTLQERNWTGWRKNQPKNKPKDCVTTGELRTKMAARMLSLCVCCDPRSHRIITPEAARGVGGGRGKGGRE